MMFITLVRRLIEEAGLSEDFEALAELQGTAARFPGLINQAYAEILSLPRWAFAWQELELDAAGGVVKLPDGHVDFDRAQVRFDGARLPERSYRIVQDLPAETGGARVYAVRPDGAIVLHPAPASGLLVLESWQQVHVLEADDDKPLIPSAWCDVIVWRALMMYAASDAATELFAHAKAKADQRQIDLVIKFAPPMRMMPEPLA